MTGHSFETMASVVGSITGAKQYGPYPAYRDSGIEWLAEIPAHWKVAPIYARYQVALGKMLDTKKNFGDSPGEYVRNSDVQWDSVNTINLPTMDFPPQERDRYRLQFGDLLVCEGGEVGRTAIWQGTTGEYFYQKAIHRVRPLSDQEVPRFLYYTMRMLSAKGVFVAGSNPNTIDHLTAVQLRHYRILFPPCTEQNAIAAFLDNETEKIDVMVERKERLIELLQEKRTALVTRAVTKGIDPDAPMKDSGVEWLGKIPAYWQALRLFLLTPSDRGIMYGIVLPGPDVQVGVPIVKGGDVSSERLCVDRLNRTSFEIEARYVRSRLRGGDLVYAIRGSIGDVAMVPDELEGANLTQDAARVAYTDETDGRWLLYALKSLAVFAQLESGALGATIRGINIRDLKRVVVPVPPNSEQRVLADYLDRETAGIDALVAKVHVAIDRLKELRTALIAAAVTGKIDVRETPT